jgi:endonuclease G
MKKLFLLFIAIISVACYKSTDVSNDTVVVKHKYYTSTYNKKLNYPVKVEYWLTKNMHVCSQHVPRYTDFMEDPQVGPSTNLDLSYVRSGYDRGHNFPAYDGSCDARGMKESFYYTNMTPQSPGLNRGGWKSLEEAIRKESEVYDSIYVAIGSFQGNSVKTIGGNGSPVVYVPATCWKAYWVKKTGKQVAYVFPNAKVNVEDINKYKVDIKTLEASTGKLFPH